MSSNLSIARRAVSRLLAWASHTNDADATNFRNLRFENLEPRCVLSANGFELDLDTGAEELDPNQQVEFEMVAPLDVDSLAATGATLSEEVQIVSLQTRLNCGLILDHPVDKPLFMTDGDTFEVVGVNFDIQDGFHGTLALEGYLEKFSDSNFEYGFDLEDGRFSGGIHASPGPLQAVGFDGMWKVETGCRRLLLVASHYAGDKVTVVEQLTVDLKVCSEPDGSDGDSVPAVFGDNSAESHDWIAGRRLSQSLRDLPEFANVSAVDGLMNSLRGDEWSELIAEADQLIASLK